MVGRKFVVFCLICSSPTLALAYGNKWVTICLDGAQHSKLTSLTLPNLWTMVPAGAFFGTDTAEGYFCWNPSPTMTSSGHLNVETAEWNFYGNTDTTIGIASYYPTIGQIWLKENFFNGTEADSIRVMYFSQSRNAKFWGHSQYPGYERYHGGVRIYDSQYMGGQEYGDSAMWSFIRDFLDSLTHAGKACHYMHIDLHGIDKTGHALTDTAGCGIQGENCNDVPGPTDPDYCDTIKWADGALGKIRTYFATADSYAGQTNILVFTDHGRNNAITHPGDLRCLKTHGNATRTGSWVFYLFYGPDIAVLAKAGHYWTAGKGRSARTIGHILGVKAPSVRTWNPQSNAILNYSPDSWTPGTQNDGSVLVSTSDTIPSLQPDCSLDKYNGKTHIVWTDGHSKIKHSGVYGENTYTFQVSGTDTVIPDSEAVMKPQVVAWHDTVLVAWLHFKSIETGAIAQRNQWKSWYLKMAKSTDGGTTWSNITLTDIPVDSGYGFSDIDLAYDSGAWLVGGTTYATKERSVFGYNGLKAFSSTNLINWAKKINVASETPLGTQEGGVGATPIAGYVSLSAYAQNLELSAATTHPLNGNYSFRNVHGTVTAGYLTNITTPKGIAGQGFGMLDSTIYFPRVIMR